FSLLLRPLLASSSMELKFVSFLGLIAMITMAWACSQNRRLFPWRTVISGTLLQFVFGCLILKTTAGEKTFDAFQRAVNKLIGFADEGSKMVFGPLANGHLLAEKWG